MNKVYAKINLDLKENVNYGMKVTSFEKVEGFVEGMKIFDVHENESQAIILDHEFATSKADYVDDKYLVPAWGYQYNDEHDYIILEFDMDSYSKFVFVTKMPNGAYVVIE